MKAIPAGAGPGGRTGAGESGLGDRGAGDFAVAAAATSGAALGVFEQAAAAANVTATIAPMLINTREENPSVFMPPSITTRPVVVSRFPIDCPALRDLLLVFLKEPRPGVAKTRLVPALRPETAARLYRLLAEEEVRRTAPLALEYRRLFCFTPPHAGEAMAAWFPGEELWPQPDGDLGVRMAAAFAEGFRRGADRVAIIGTDVPWLDRACVQESFAALADHDVAVGPARDGGYYLLALRVPQASLFVGVAWSTAAVLPATLARADALGLRVKRLSPLTDLDTLEDLDAEWERLVPLLRTEPGLAQEVAAALRRPPPS